MTIRPNDIRSQEWTQPQIVARLLHFKGTMMLEDFAQVIYRATGREISWSHLSNMLSGRKMPSKTVLDFLGLERVVVYRVKGWRPRKGR